jgi:hypothetical protein
VTTGKPSLVVIHWTGAENPPEAVYRNLGKRRPPPTGLGTHLITDGLRVVQVCDMQHAALCGGPTNERAVHIEAKNKGRGVSAKRVTRREHYHGAMQRVLGFEPIELDAIARVTVRLCDALGIPRIIPARAGTIFPDVLSRRQLARFSGVLGHFMVSGEKLDPGMGIFEHLAINYGFRLVNV